MAMLGDTRFGSISLRGSTVHCINTSHVTYFSRVEELMLELE